MIFINDIPSVYVESLDMDIDDRIEKVELINGNAVQDYGHVETGDVLSLVCIFSLANYLRVHDLWTRRELVTFTDVAGAVWNNLRLVFKRARYVDRFENYLRVELELWRI